MPTATTHQSKDGCASELNLAASGLPALRAARRFVHRSLLRGVAHRRVSMEFGPPLATVLAVACFFSLLVGCRAPVRGPANDMAPSADASETPHASPNTSGDASGIDAPLDTDATLEAQGDRWLVVVKAAKVESGCWAKGDFDAERNKIAIITDNVSEFTIDTEHLPINWNRVVIISIDGVSAELRPRDYSPLRFRREGFSSWSVVEP